MHSSTLALPLVSSDISVSWQRETGARCLPAVCLVLGWLLLLMLALGAEVAVVFAVGTVIKAVSVNRPAYMYVTSTSFPKETNQGESK